MTKNNFTYRKGTINDVRQLQELRVISYGQFQNAFTPDNWTLFNEKIRNEQRLIDLLKISNCFICLSNDEIIGMAFIVSNGHPTDVFKSEWTYIKMVGVNPNYQGQGVARTLIKTCIDHAIQNNEKTIALTTSEFMDAARHIYENLGFKIFKQISPLFGKKYWLYTLDLN